MHARWGALGGAVVTVASGLAVRSWGDGAFAKYAGDALYTVLVCCVVALVAPRLGAGVVAGIGLAFSCAVEFLQIAGIPAVLRPLLGATFNPPDLFWYFVGSSLYWCLAHGAQRRAEPNAGI
ncbi:DUF2809 domain-containing protein [Streptomyces sp. NPDC001904]|uniref:ribosomal maturation YjgA family protein n=1 Tax=Streptomyces sp. NPDC001904 TaxID=3154531 RepID=UPI00332DBC92